MKRITNTNDLKPYGTLYLVQHVDDEYPRLVQWGGKQFYQNLLNAPTFLDHWDMKYIFELWENKE